MDFSLAKNNKSYVYDTFRLVWIVPKAETETKTWMEVSLGNDSRKHSGVQEE